MANDERRSRSSSCDSTALHPHQRYHREQQHPREWCRFILDLLLFYTTAFFVLLAIISLFALVFLVPFFIDPAWSTLQADFDPNGTKCKTVSSVYKEGTNLIGFTLPCCTGQLTSWKNPPNKVLNLSDHVHCILSRLKHIHNLPKITFWWWFIRPATVHSCTWNAINFF